MLHDVRGSTDLQPFERSRVGVLGFIGADGSPRSCAVTPYVVDGELVVSSTLAYLAKIRAIADRPVVALFADGAHASADAVVEMHATSDWFDTQLRHQERIKYPPARTLLAIPFHRRLLWWYVGRAVVTFTDPTIDRIAGSDRVTITTLVDGRPRIHPLGQVDVHARVIEVGADVEDGPACLLVHDEDDDMAELRQLTLRGIVTHGSMHVERRSGSLESADHGILGQLRSLRALSRAASANRTEIGDWDRRPRHA